MGAPPKLFLRRAPVVAPTSVNWVRLRSPPTSQERDRAKVRDANPRVGAAQHVPVRPGHVDGQALPARAEPMSTAAAVRVEGGTRWTPAPWRRRSGIPGRSRSRGSRAAVHPTRSLGRRLRQREQRLATQKGSQGRSRRRRPSPRSRRPLTRQAHQPRPIHATDRGHGTKGNVGSKIGNNHPCRTNPNTPDGTPPHTDRIASQLREQPHPLQEHVMSVVSPTEAGPLTSGNDDLHTSTS